MTIGRIVIVAILGALIGIAIAINIGGSRIITGLDEYSAVVITVLTVMLAGIVGGCVSMLQRIQSSPTDGDALFNLAALNSGWRGIMLSPLYGGIFAFLLFVLFAGGVLNGSVFPTITTPQRGQVASPTPSPAAGLPRTPTPTPSPVTAASPTNSPLTQPANVATPAATTVSRAETQSPTPTPAAVSRGGVLQIKQFLQETGPSSGISYALLIVWSFLAGFAERLVPDTLNRLVQKNINAQGGS